MTEITEGTVVVNPGSWRLEHIVFYLVASSDPKRIEKPFPVSEEVYAGLRSKLDASRLGEDKTLALTTREWHLLDSVCHRMMMELTVGSAGWDVAFEIRIALYDTELSLMVLEATEVT